MAMAMVGFLIIMLGGIAGAGRFTYSGSGWLLVAKYCLCGPNLLVTLGVVTSLTGAIRDLIG